MYTTNVFRRFKPNEELSEIATKLWELDENRCEPGVDFELDLQGKLSYSLGLQNKLITFALCLKRYFVRIIQYCRFQNYVLSDVLKSQISSSFWVRNPNFTTVIGFRSLAIRHQFTIAFV